MPKPVDAIYKLFSNPVGGLQITADDNSEILDAFDRKDPNAPGPYIDLERDPYAQEGKGDARPQVIVGPSRNVLSAPFIGLQWHEVHVRVEVRIITRDWTGDGLGFTLNHGDVTADKIRDAIVLIVEANKSNPAGDGSILACWVSDMGMDDNVSDGPAKYMKTMQLELMWLA